MELRQLKTSLRDVNSRAKAAIERSQTAALALDNARSALTTLQEKMTSELTQVGVLRGQMEEMLRSGVSRLSLQLDCKVDALEVLFANLDARMGSVVSRADLGDVEARCTATVHGRATTREVKVLESAVLREVTALTTRMDGLRLDDILGATTEM